MSFRSQWAKIERLEREYARLCEDFELTEDPDGFWRANRFAVGGPLPPQGFKLHVSATVLSANEILELCGAYLSERRVHFKVVPSLRELSNLNSGMFYGFSQVGKFLTVYPVDPQQAVEIAEDLHRLTVGLEGPAVPFDKVLRPGSRVSYRYGSFLPGTSDEGGREWLTDGKGRRVVDRREFGRAVPRWVHDPFPPVRDASTESAAFGPYRAFECLSQRGKGGVYRALDLSSAALKEVVMKEGRKDGEIGFDGRDGHWRIKHEASVLSQLRSLPIGAPQVLGCFEAGDHCYLVLEKIEGVNLNRFIQRRRRLLPFQEFAPLGLRICRILARLHEAGWAWRDLKPLNLILTPEGELRPHDFEGAARFDNPDRTAWGTPGYTPTWWSDLEVNHEGEDLFALGATFFHLITGSVLVDYEARTKVSRVRRGYPAEVKSLVLALLDAEVRKRPRARAAEEILARHAAALEVGPAADP